MARVIKNKEADKAVSRFERWMIKRVKSVHFANKEAMNKAFLRVYEANLS